MSPRPKKPAARVARKPRVPALERRRQILDVANGLLSERGIDSVQITTVASHARVSRPLVYRLFPTRQALIVALLEDFASILSAKFRQTLVERLPDSVEAITRLFIEACCDAIEERGAGAWRLLDARDTEADVAVLGRSILARLMAPWHPKIAEFTGLSKRRATILAHVITSAGRAMLEGWIDGHVSRAEALRDTTRTVSALLREFTKNE